MIDILTVLAAVGAGVIGGLLFAFSNVVMRSLDEESPEAAVRLMNRINVVIVNPLFILVFAGTAVLAAVTLVLSVVQDGDGRGFRVAGACCYLVGVIGVTAVFHIPRNNALATAKDSELSLAWTSFSGPWTRGNHLRAMAAVASAALFVCSLL